MAPARRREETSLLSFDCELTEGSDTLFAYDGLTARLTGIEIGEGDYEDALLLHVSVDNDGDVDKELWIDMATLNGATIPGNGYSYISYIDVPAGGSAEGTFELSLKDMSFAQITSPVENDGDRLEDRGVKATFTHGAARGSPAMCRGRRLCRRCPSPATRCWRAIPMLMKNLELTLVSLAQVKDGLALQLRARNLTEEYIDLALDHLALNGWELGNELVILYTIAPRAEYMMEFTIPDYALAYAGETPQQLRMAFYATRSDSLSNRLELEPLFVTEEIQWSLVPKEPLPLANESGVRVSLLPGQLLLNEFSYVRLTMLVENDTQSAITVEMNNFRVNGQACELLSSKCNVSRRAKALHYSFLYDRDFFKRDLAGQTIESITADIELWNGDTGVLLATIPDVECVYYADAD